MREAGRWTTDTDLDVRRSWRKLDVRVLSSQA